MTYEKRLEILGLTTLETKTLRGDLIEVYKIIHSNDNLDSGFFFEKSNTICRGHSYKLSKFRSNFDIRKFSLSQRVVNEWNLLTEKVVSSPILAYLRSN